MIPIARWIRAWVDFSMDRFGAVLLVLAVVTAAMLWRGTQIEIDPDLKSLLPEDAPSVQAIEEAAERRGGIDMFIVAIRSPEPAQTVRFMDDLYAELEDWEEADWIEIRKERDFFRDNALMFLPVHELDRVLDNLQRMRRERTGEANPLFVDLEDTGEEEDTFDERDSRNWISDATLMELNLSRSEISTIFTFMDGDTALEDDEGDDEPPDPEMQRIRELRLQLPAQYDDYQLSFDGEVGVLTAKLKGQSTDIQYAERAYNHVMGIVAELDPSTYHPDMLVDIAGAYRSFDEVDAIGGDMITATSISIGLVLVLLIGFFRSIRSVFLVLTPLLVGIAWTLGAIELLYGHLNTLTAFVFSMLIGMGIDTGIHIYRRTLEEYATGSDWKDSVYTSITLTGRALLTATMTTVASLLTLTLAHFDGFNEFGIACAMGIALCLIASVLVTPPLVAALEALRPLKRPTHVAPPKETSGGGLMMRAIIVGAVLISGYAVWSATVVTDAEFEHDFRNLEAPSTRAKTGYSKAMGNSRSSAPAIILGESEEQMRAVHQILRERFEEGDEMLGAFQTIESIVPGDQEARLEVIWEICDEVDRRAWRNAEGEDAEMVEALLGMCDVEPFTVDDLPEWSRRSLIEKDGSIGAMGLLFAKYDSRDAHAVAEFQERFGELVVDGEVVPISSNGFIIADVVRYVKADAALLGFYVALALTLILIIDLRSVIGVISCVASLAVAVVVVIGTMVLLDIKVGLYNMVVLPTVLGVGIDGVIHVYHRAVEEGTERMSVVMRTTGAAVAASSITTAAGFVGLLLVDHLGIRTIGQLAVTGIIASFLVAWTVLPAILLLLARLRRRTDS